jgi:hypothetical protein
MKHVFLHLILASLAFSEGPFTEINGVTPFYTPGPASIISPTGKYFVNVDDSMDFEVRDLVSGAYVLQSKYVAHMSPYPRYNRPSKIYFVFSPDDKYLLADNYVFSDTSDVPEKNWIEVWHVERSRVVDRLTDALETLSSPARFNYNVKSSLYQYYNSKPYRAYVKGQRIVFSPDGRKIFLLYPVFRVFTFPGLNQIYGRMNLVGTDKRDGHLYLNHTGAPLILNNGKSVVLPVKGNTLLFHDFFNNIQDYSKVGGTYGHMEISNDDRFLLLGGKLYRTQYWAVRTSFPGPVFVSADSKWFLAGSGIFSAEPPFDKAPASYVNTNKLVPSSDRRFLFATDRLKRRLSVYTFSASPKLLQSFKIWPDEYLFRNTDDGRRLIIKDKASGKIKLFERKN